MKNRSFNLLPLGILLALVALLLIVSASATAKSSSNHPHKNVPIVDTTTSRLETIEYIQTKIDIAIIEQEKLKTQMTHATERLNQINSLLRSISTQIRSLDPESDVYQQYLSLYTNLYETLQNQYDLEADSLRTQQRMLGLAQQFEQYLLRKKKPLQ